jgi:HAD superfamily hydrolase (TIGR01509 family)
MKALLLGSIGVLAETSELQRRAYNSAFVAHGVDWHWNIAAYCQHLAIPGGQNRLWKLGGDALSTTEIRRIHETKQDAFAASLVGGIAPRPGIVDTLTAARAAGLRIGFVTTTTPRTIAMIREALSGHIDMSDFAVITSKEDVVREKPDGACYELALSRLGIASCDALAIEDTVASQSAAVAAGIRCHLYTGSYALAEDAPLQTRNPADALKADLAPKQHESKGLAIAS